MKNILKALKPLFLVYLPFLFLSVPEDARAVYAAVS